MNKNIKKLLVETTLKISLAIASISLLVACDANNTVDSITVGAEEEIDINQNPLTAIQRVIESARNNNYEEYEEESINKQAPVEPVSLQELIEYLPPVPSGWTAEKPKGQTNSFGNYSIAHIKQTYSRNDKTMTVTIFDWAFNSALYLPFILSTEFSQESTEGYNKGIKIGEIPGREEYDYHTKDGSLNLLINQRFFVQIDGKNIEETELREWWELLDYRALTKVNSKVDNTQLSVENNQ